MCLCALTLYKDDVKRSSKHPANQGPEMMDRPPGEPSVRNRVAILNVYYKEQQSRQPASQGPEMVDAY